MEFLSSRNQAAGLFIIDKFILVFEKEYARVYSVDHKTYDSVNISAIFTYLDKRDERFVIRS